MTGPRLARLGVVAAVGLLASCAQVPDHGPVVEAKEPGQNPPAVGQYNQPKGPQPEDSPDDIVNGFLEAMTATPLKTTIAQQFLAKQAQTQWQPRRVVTYSDHTPPRGTDMVVVRILGADQVGIRGQWQGRVAPDARRLVFPMVRENDEWRIAAAPDALIVPRSFYDQQYQEAEIYFFDPTARILVPEPVHVPEGSQLASSLVRALLRGPPVSLAGVVRTFLPPGLEVLSVPVGADGVADVSLKGPDPGPLNRKSIRLILTQLTWTLRQDPSIVSFRLSIAGRQISDAAGKQSFGVDSRPNDPYDPAVSLASSQFYALRAGRLVSGQIGEPTPVDGPFGTESVGIGPFAVSLDGNTVAGVTSTSLLVGPVLGASQPTEVLRDSSLLRPAWDFAGRLWDVHDGSDGAVVFYVGRHLGHHEVKVPGITGEDVRRFLVSRDGSRIVAVLRGRNSDRIVVSRLRYASDSGDVRGTRARPIPWLSSGTTRVRDLGWTSPTTLAVLDRLSPSQAEVRILNVDGSTPAGQSSPTPISGTVLGLATSPVATQTPYAVQRGRLVDTSQVDLARPLQTEGLRHVTYAG